MSLMTDKTFQTAIKSYLKSLSASYAKGNATEHTYRPAFQNFLQAVLPEANVTNEPKQIECGAPDFVLSHNNIPRGYIEAKDIDKNLDDAGFKEQFGRYRESLGNLIFTDYLEFRLVRDGDLINTVSIGTIAGGKVKQTPQHFDDLADLLNAFWGYQGQTITSANNLAKFMAAKTRMLAGVIKNALDQKNESLGLSDEISEMDDELLSQLNAFKERLIHDLEPATFADIYAQTIAYGLFSARLHDTTLDTFTRHEAAELIPAANPFLRRFFQYIAGYDLDSRISWIVDDLADLFRAVDVGELMKDYGKSTQRNDPFLHFYETFLAEYNPKLRKSRGVYYTPEPVVNFIVRAVDDILQTRFDLAQGLADTSKTVIEVDTLASPRMSVQGENKKAEIHKVQILDPATGTGTFLSNIVQYIYQTRFANQKGIWPEYVRSDLIPRLNGFEILMASYAMAHTKLEMVLRDTGCEIGNKRLRIFLTNSLEEHKHDKGAMFSQWLASEAKAADSIKLKTPVMVVIGNPPYSGESANKGEWITDLLSPYKEEPGGGKLQEKNPKWLNDDYVKFIRYGQHYIDRTGEGVLAYINNHSYLDNPTFRGMRWSLMQSFDVIYIIDLHGNSKKKEIAPDGSPDQNVFDIQQGVSINLFVKTGEKKASEPAQVFHYDLYGRREGKYQFLWDHDLARIGFKQLDPQPPQYFFVPKDYRLQAEYDKGISLAELFPVNSVGIVTARDGFTIYHTPQELKAAIAEFRGMDDETARARFSLGRDAMDWKVALARRDLEENIFAEGNDEAVAINYRPFDSRYTYYTGNSKGFLCRSRGEVMRHFLKGENVGLITSRITKDTFSVLCTKHIAAHKSATVYDISYIFPLYLYPDARQQHIDQERIPNLDQDIVEVIAKGLELHFTPEKQEDDTSFAPVDIFDYIYAVLHSPSYRERYKEFLKTDFPKVPYPSDKELFWKLVKLGSDLRLLHLMEHPDSQQLITGYNVLGSNQVEKIDFEIKNPNDMTGNVHINDTQYFDGVPKTAWDFYIGGYQPVQKWLKDRKGRTLSSDDLMHYQRIIVALMKTADIMSKIDKLQSIPQQQN